MCILDVFHDRLKTNKLESHIFHVVLDTQELLYFECSIYSKRVCYGDDGFCASHDGKTNLWAVRRAGDAQRQVPCQNIKQYPNDDVAVFKLQQFLSCVSVYETNAFFPPSLHYRGTAHLRFLFYLSVNSLKLSGAGLFCPLIFQ